MRGFLILLVGMMAAFVGGHFFGETALDAVAEKSGWERPASALEEQITANAALEETITQLNGEVARLDQELRAAESLVEQASSSEQSQPEPVVPAKLIHLQARVYLGNSKSPLSATFGTTPSRLVSLYIKVTGGDQNETLSCSVKSFRFALARGQKPIQTIKSNNGTPISLTPIRAQARSGDRLVVQNIVAQCGEQIFGFDDMSFPIR